MNAWKRNNFSRREINSAGDILRESFNFEDPNFLESYLNAYQIMDDWRSSHAFPLNTLQMTLRRRARSIDKNSVIAQRLKRAPSVILKLRRNESMQLGRMQDLGGCRAVLNTVDSVYKLRKIYRESRDRHALAGEKDYIQTPRDTGYRGYHLIYKYESDRSSEFNGHRIELQIRTRVQHAWATAVEIAGTFTGTSLKSSIGPEDWLEFFKYASSAFAIYEDTPRLHCSLADGEIREAFSEYGERLGAFTRLRGFSVAQTTIQKNRRKNDSHFILYLDLEANILKIERFQSVGPATLRFATIEKEVVNDPTKDVVLVAAESIASVQSAYPNYFADTRDFLSFSSTVLGN